MSRPIKFRAWDKVEKKMVHVSSVSFSHRNDGTMWFATPKGEGEHVHEIVIDGELMQFTGLHDKNGKEIFEGDILKVKWSIKSESPDSEWKAEEHIAGVEWSHPGWKIRWSYFSKPFEIDGNKELCWYDDYHRSNQPGAFHKLTEFEVLGNIYESPELLNKENVQ